MEAVFRGTLRRCFLGGGPSKIAIDFFEVKISSNSSVVDSRVSSVQIMAYS